MVEDLSLERFDSNSSCFAQMKIKGLIMWSAEEVYERVCEDFNYCSPSECAVTIGGHIFLLLAIIVLQQSPA